MALSASIMRFFKFGCILARPSRFQSGLFRVNLAIRSFDDPPLAIATVSSPNDLPKQTALAVLTLDKRILTASDAPIVPVNALLQALILRKSSGLYDAPFAPLC